MTKPTLRNKLDLMVGKLFTINGALERVEKWSFENDNITLVTDKDTYEISLTVADQRLAEFIPANDQDTLPERVNHLPQRACNTETLAQLRDIMLQNIQKIQEDKNYLPQAQEVSKSVGVIVDLAKTEIDYLKAIKNL